MRNTEGTLLIIATLKGQKGIFSAIDVKRADRVWKFQETVGFPSTKGLLDMIDNCVVKNIPISRLEVQIAMDIYGPSRKISKGKMVRRQLGQVTTDIMPVPCGILNWYSWAELHIDVLQVKGTQFLLSTSVNLYFWTAK